MDLYALKNRLAELYPGSESLTAQQVNDAMDTLRAETETVTQPTRVTLLGVAHKHGNALSTRLAESLRATAATDGYVDEIVHLLRNGNGVDVSHDAAKQMLDQLAANADLPLTADDATLVKAMAQNDVPKWPGVTVSKIKQARAL